MPHHLPAASGLKSNASHDRSPPGEPRLALDWLSRFDHLTFRMLWSPQIVTDSRNVQSGPELARLRVQDKAASIRSRDLVSARGGFLSAGGADQKYEQRSGQKAQ